MKKSDKSENIIFWTRIRTYALALYQLSAPPFPSGELLDQA